jgi:peptidoglycan/LPS O-acetylase OafA/YrhL
MQPRQRLDHVHGLRGIAALVVVFQHATQFVQEAGVRLYEPLLHTINLGRFGVILFFLISGLVIPFSFHGDRPLRGFVIGRFFRLYPIYWLSIPLLGGMWVVMFGRTISVETVLANLTMLQGFWGGRNIGAGYWTLTYEIGFYILCAIVFWLGRLDDPTFNGLALAGCLALAIGIVLTGLALGRDTVWPQAPYFVGMFLLGMLLRRAFVDDCAVARRFARWLVPLAMIAGVVVSGWIVPSTENTNAYLRPLPLMMGSVLPIVAFVLVLWRKPKPGKPLIYLGTISYSLYLLQDIGLLMLPRLLPPGAWPIGYVLAVIGLTAVIATLTYHLVERPMIALGRSLAGRRSIASGESLRI